MKKVVITGVAGFIGSHLADRFIAEGYYVIGIDNFITGKRENIEHLKNNANFQFIEKDLGIEDDLDIEADIILNFASPASPVDYFKKPIETMRVNAIGTLKMLKLAKKNNAVFVQASTSEVYGDPEVHPQKEEYFGHVNPVGPRSVYDEGKRFAEALSMAFFREFGVKVRLIRIFNTYGPRMKADDGRVIPNFINQALKNKPITIYGDGKQTRSYCFVDDLVEGIYRVSIKEDIDGEIFNLGNPEEYTIIQTAQIIKELTNSNSDFKFLPPLQDDPKRRCPDISKAKTVLDWKPEVSFREGLEKTIDFFKGKLVNG